MRPIEERGHRHLVGRVQDDRRAAAALERGPGQAQAREASGSGSSKVSATDPGQIQARRPGVGRRSGYVSA